MVAERCQSHYFYRGRYSTLKRQRLRKCSCSSLSVCDRDRGLQRVSIQNCWVAIVVPGMEIPVNFSLQLSTGRVFNLSVACDVCIEVGGEKAMHGVPAEVRRVPHGRLEDQKRRSNRAASLQPFVQQRWACCCCCCCCQSFRFMTWLGLDARQLSRRCIKRSSIKALAHCMNGTDVCWFCCSSMCVLRLPSLVGVFLPLFSTLRCEKGEEKQEEEHPQGRARLTRTYLRRR